MLTFLLLPLVVVFFYARSLPSLNRRKRDAILAELNKPHNSSIVAFFHPYW